MNISMNELLMGAVGVVFLLASVAGYLHWQLYLLRKRVRAREEEVQRQEVLARERANKSIQIICKALLVDQVSCAEASLRICGLIDQMRITGKEREEFIAFEKMANAIKHIPIREDWKRLPKEQRIKFESNMNEQEVAFGDFMRASAEKIIGRGF